MSEMSENSNHTANDSPGTSNNSAPVTAEELTQVIQEFEQYRQRLVEDMTNAAKKAKLSKSKMMTKLEPELAQIDTALERLRVQYAAIAGK